MVNLYLLTVVLAVIGFGRQVMICCSYKCPLPTNGIYERFCALDPENDYYTLALRTDQSARMSKKEIVVKPVWP